MSREEIEQKLSETEYFTKFVASNNFIDRNSIENPLKKTRIDLDFDGGRGTKIDPTYQHKRNDVKLSYNKAEVVNH